MQMIWHREIALVTVQCGGPCAICLRLLLIRVRSRNAGKYFATCLVFGRLLRQIELSLVNTSPTPSLALRDSACRVLAVDSHYFVKTLPHVAPRNASSECSSVFTCAASRRIGGLSNECVFPLRELVDCQDWHRLIHCRRQHSFANIIVLSIAVDHTARPCGFLGQ